MRFGISMSSSVRRAGAVVAAGVLAVATGAGAAGAVPVKAGVRSAAVQGGPDVSGFDLLLRAEPWTVLQTRRANDRSWDQPHLVPQLAGLFHWTVVVQGGRLRLFGAQAIGYGRHYVQSAQQADGSWSALVPMTGVVDLPVSQQYGQMGRMTSSLVNGQVQVSAIDGAGRVVHTVEGPGGVWQPWSVVSAASGLGSGPFFSLATAELNGELQMVGTTVAGEVLHTIRHADGSWQPWGNVMGATGTPSPWGWTTDVAVAAINGQLQVVVEDNSMAASYHAIRRADGSWTPWGNIPAQVGFNLAGYPSLPGVEAAAVNGELQLLWETSSNAGDIYHTIRHADGSWDRVGHVQDAINLSPYRVVPTGAGAGG